MPEACNDLRVFNDFDRNPELLKKFDTVLQALSAAAIFADVQYRTGVMDSAIKPAFRAKVTGQAVMVDTSRSRLGFPGDTYGGDSSSRTVDLTAAYTPDAER